MKDLSRSWCVLVLVYQGCFFGNKDKNDSPPPAKEIATPLETQPFHCPSERGDATFKAIDKKYATIETNDGRLKLKWKTPIRNIAFISDARDFVEEDVLNTCLLYTSPSPRDATLSRMPSSA